MTPKVKLSLISDSRDEKIYLLNPPISSVSMSLSQDAANAADNRTQE